MDERLYARPRAGSPGNVGACCGVLPGRGCVEIAAGGFRRSKYATEGLFAVARRFPTPLTHASVEFSIRIHSQTIA